MTIPVCVSRRQRGVAVSKPNMPLSDSAIPPRLRGLKLERLFAEASSKVGSPMLPVPWTPPEPAELAPLFPGFEFVRLIGRGGMGAVYEALQTALERRVAIKLLPIEAGEDSVFADRFRREARTLAKLLHPHIVAVFESGETAAGHLFFVMEYLDGGDLAVRARNGLLEPAETLRIVDEISAALSFAHGQGVVHRDIKPSNILLTADGRVKVADFGLAVLESREADSKLTLTGIALGTFDYAAPEQLAGRGKEDARSDLYSLGVLSYELLAGKPPRGVFDPPSQANPAVDPAVDAVVLTALQSEPDRRYQSAADFSAALNRARDFRANQLARERELRRKARRRTRLALAAVFAAVAAIGVAAFAFHQKRVATRKTAEAEMQRSAANAARGEAEGLVDFILTDLRNKSEEAGNLEKLTGVLARVEKYYAESATPADETAFLLKKAAFFKIDADTRKALGDKHRAEAGYRRFIALVEPLLARGAAEPAWHGPLSIAFGGVAEMQAAAGNAEGARDSAAQGLGVALSWRRVAPSVESGTQVIHMHSHLGDLFAQSGSTDRAQEEYRAAERVVNELLASDPKSNGTTYMMAGRVQSSLGTLSETKGDTEAALAFYVKMKEFYDLSGILGSPENQAIPEVRIGAALRRLGRQAEAIPHLEKAVDGEEKNLARKPLDGLRMANAAHAHAELSKALDGVGRSVEAAEHAKRKDELTERKEQVSAAAKANAPVSPDAAFEKLRAAPEGNDVQFYWSMDLQNEGTRIEQARGVDAAIEYFRSYVARIDAELKTAPPGSWWHLGRSFALNRIGYYEVNRKNYPPAAEAYRTSLADREMVLAAHPEVDRLSRDLASSATHLIHTLVEMDGAAEAGEICRRMMVLLHNRERGKLTWRDLLPRAAIAIAPKLDPAATGELLDEAAVFLTAPGEDSLPSNERALLEQIRAEKK